MDRSASMFLRASLMERGSSFPDWRPSFILWPVIATAQSLARTARALRAAKGHPESLGRFGF